MDFSLNEMQLELQNAARKFAEEELMPNAEKWDEEKYFPVEVIKKAGELGFLSIYTPEVAGGMGLSRTDAAIIFEELARGCTSTGAYVTIHNMCTWMVGAFGSDFIREKYIPQMSSGDLFGSYCLTEPGSGSDAASLKTKAVDKGDFYEITGSKMFISGGGSADVLVVMARTGDDTPRGISAFVVEGNYEGIEWGKNESKMGWNSQPTKALTLTNVKVPKENLLGSLGEGFKIAMKGLDGGRINIAACSIGAAQACLEHSRKYMSERSQFGKTLDKIQVLQFKLADMATKLVASRQLVRLAANKLDSDSPEKTAYCAMAKQFATEECFWICDEAIQLHGGYGYTKEYPVERYQRDSRVHRILEGTNEIMKLVISRQLIGDQFENIR